MNETVYSWENNIFSRNVYQTFNSNSALNVALNLHFFSYFYPPSLGKYILNA